MSNKFNHPDVVDWLHDLAARPSGLTSPQIVALIHRQTGITISPRELDAEVQRHRLQYHLRRAQRMQTRPRGV